MLIRLPSCLLLGITNWKATKENTIYFSRLYCIFKKPEEVQEPQAEPLFYSKTLSPLL